VIEIKRILCPIDFSEYSGHALDYAVAVGGWYGATVTALHVYAEWPAVGMIPGFGPDAMPPVRLQAVDREAVLQHMRAFVAPHAAGGVAIDVQLQEAPDVHREVLAQAQSRETDLLVVGSHGRSGFEHLLLGSITEKLVRRAACPVMVVPRRIRTDPEHAVHVKQILCPVDFSRGSTAALTMALSLAEEADAHLTLLYVEEMPPELAQHPVFASIDVDAVRAEAHAEWLRRLRALVPDAVKAYCTVDTAVSEGRASRAILRVAAERATDVIVMGVQGRGGVDMAIFGSNTNEVLRGATCPVLTVRQP
jgi:nucleotide-binding universal stress UspA family protein